MPDLQMNIAVTLLYLFAAAIVGGILALRLRMPLIVGYITAGLVLGNILPFDVDREFLTVLSEIGVTLLLFSLGIEFSFQRFRAVVGFVGWASVVQMILVFLVIYMLLLVFEIPFLAALFIAVAASLSSTAIAVKIFSEQGDIDTAHGEASIAWLIVQDLGVVVIMFLLPVVVSAAGNENTSLVASLMSVVINMGKALLVLVYVIFAGKNVLPKIFARIVRLRSRELFVISIVSVVLLSASVTVAMGLSAAIGAFLAGLLIAETSQNHAVFSEIRPLRDVFSVVFFVSIGLLIHISAAQSVMGLIIVLALVILLVKSSVVYALTRFIGYHRKAAYRIALSLLPMSEFGFVLAEEGRKAGALSGDTYLTLVLISFLTILIGSPIFANHSRLYARIDTILLSRIPKLFPEKTFGREIPISPEGHVVLCGYGRVGRYIGRALEMSGIPFVVVDYNQSALNRAHDRGYIVVNGDPADREILEHAHLVHAKILIIALPDRHTQEMVIGNARSINKHIQIICRSHHEQDQKHLRALGVDSIVQPEFEAAVSITSKLLTGYGVNGDEIAGKISRLKIEHGLG